MNNIGKVDVWKKETYMLPSNNLGSRPCLDSNIWELLNKKYLFLLFLKWFQWNLFPFLIDFEWGLSIIIIYIRILKFGLIFLICFFDVMSLNSVSWGDRVLLKRFAYCIILQLCLAFETLHHDSTERIFYTRYKKQKNIC